MNNRHRAIKRYRAKRFGAILLRGRAMLDAAGSASAISIKLKAIEKTAALRVNAVQLGKPYLIITGIDSEVERNQIDYCRALGLSYSLRAISDIRKSCMSISSSSSSCSKAAIDALECLRREPLTVVPLVMAQPEHESFSEFVDKMLIKVSRDTEYILKGIDNEKEA